MFDTRVKICGITSPDDAILSLTFGADYLGLIFADSSRRIGVADAIEIRKAVPQAMLVGVFSGTPVEEVAEISRACKLNMIQLHGTESPDYCEVLLSKVSLPIIKAIRLGDLPDIGRMRDFKRTSYFLFDLDKNTKSRVQSSTVNGDQERLWDEAAMRRARGYRIFLAGSLGPSNVRQAVRYVAPYGIDVASGVEKSPGVKDPAALSRFIKEAKS